MVQSNGGPRVALDEVPNRVVSEAVVRRRCLTEDRYPQRATPCEFPAFLALGYPHERLIVPRGKQGVKERV